MLVLGACGAGDEDEQRRATPPSSITPTTRPPALVLGVQADLGPVRATALEYRQDFDPTAATTDLRSDALHVNICNAIVEPNLDEESLFSSTSWFLIDDDFETTGTVYESSAPTAPTPAFPDRDLSIGECQEGWIHFEVARDARPTRAVYSTLDMGEGYWFLDIVSG